LLLSVSENFARALARLRRPRQVRACTAVGASLSRVIRISLRHVDLEIAP
jgi:hypothetical protein